MAGIDDALRMERTLLNVWPSVRTERIGGWAVRSANGYSGRANSASAVARNVSLSPAQLHEIEAFYRAEGLPPTFRLTPLVDGMVWPALARAGYRVSDSNHTMAAGLTDVASDQRVVLESAYSAAWLDGVCRSQSGYKRKPDFLQAIVSRLQIPAVFAMLHDEGRARAFGFSAVDENLAEFGCIVVDQDQRGKGFGRAIVTSLMSWAAAHGATQGFLQVSQDNANAIGLYRSLGFTDAYDYQTVLKFDT